MKKYVQLSILIIAFFCNAHMQAQIMYKVKNVSQINGSSNPQKYINVGALSFFMALDATHGNEMWRTDGTAAGTFMLKDINAGTQSGLDSHYPTLPLSVALPNGKFVFIATDSTFHANIWGTDGTTAGTHKLSNIISGGTAYDMSVVLFNNNAYFWGDNGDIWKTDGTISGTVLIASNLITAGVEPSRALVPAGNLLFFIGYDASHGYELWKTDGTSGGTVLVKDINPGTADGLNSTGVTLAGINNTLYFSANDGVHGTELWTSDGTTAGTVFMKDINPGPSDGFAFYYDTTAYYKTSVQPHFTNINSTVYFAAYDTTHNVELWKSDGTPSGTMLVKDINPLAGSFPSQFYLCNNQLVFNANSSPPDSSNGYKYLWKSDGTTAGTIPIINLDTVPTNKVVGNTYPNDFFTWRNKVYFFTGSTSHNVLWTTDATTAGTMPVLVGGIATSYYAFSGFNSVDTAQGNLYIAYTDSLNRNSLWKGDASTGNFTLFKSISNAQYASIGSIHSYKNGFLFAATDSINGQEPWISDGTPTGTHLITNINGDCGNDIANLKDVNGILYFTLQEATNSTHIYKTNGIAEGTKVVNPGQLSTFFNASMVYRDNLYYTIYNCDSTFQCGANASVIFSDSTCSFVQTLDNLMYFFGPSGGLYLSDGKSAGTKLIASDIYESVVNQPLVKNGNSLYIVNLNNWLQKIDLSGSTTVTTVFNAGTVNSSPIVYNDTIYFIASTQIPDTLWFGSTYNIIWNYVNVVYTTDGTAAGTKTINNQLNPSSILVGNNQLLALSANGLYALLPGYNQDTLIKQVSSANNLIKAGSNMFFETSDATNGTKLWVTDGTPSGTSTIGTISATSGAITSQFVVKNNNIYFVADDGIHGAEPWMSDGTTNGTKLIYDINPQGASCPYVLPVVSGNNIYYTANDGTPNAQLWVYGITTMADCFASYSTIYNLPTNTFMLYIDSVTAAQATSYTWDFGDGTTSNLPHPTHTYANNAIYSLCLNVRTASGDSCSFCQNIGIDSIGVLSRPTTGGFNINVQNAPNATGINQNQTTNLNLYPNPTNGNFIIQTNSTHKQVVNLYDINGKLVLTQIISGKTTVDASCLSDGIYNISIIGNEGVTNKRLVIVH